MAGPVLPACLLPRELHDDLPRTHQPKDNLMVTVNLAESYLILTSKLNDSLALSPGCTGSYLIPEVTIKCDCIACCYVAAVSPFRQNVTDSLGGRSSVSSCTLTKAILLVASRVGQSHCSSCCMQGACTTG